MPLTFLSKSSAPVAICATVTLTKEVRESLVAAATKKMLSGSVTSTAKAVSAAKKKEEQNAEDVNEEVSAAVLAAQKKKAEMEKAEAEEKEARDAAKAKARQLKAAERREDLAGDESHLIAEAAALLVDPLKAGEFALSLLSKFEVKRLLRRHSEVQASPLHERGECDYTF